MSYIRKPFPSPEAQNLVVSQIQDSSLSYMERSSLASVALTLSLSSEEKAMVQRVQSEVQAYFSDLAEEQLRALSEESN